MSIENHPRLFPVFKYRRIFTIEKSSIQQAEQQELRNRPNLFDTIRSLGEAALKANTVQPEPVRVNNDESTR